MSIKDGGSAFPVADMASDVGMSLRDYFAAHAPTLQMDSFRQGESALRIDAARAWRWADALLAERDRK